MIQLNENNLEEALKKIEDFEKQDDPGELNTPEAVRSFFNRLGYEPTKEIVDVFLSVNTLDLDDTSLELTTEELNSVAGGIRKRKTKRGTFEAAYRYFRRQNFKRSVAIFAARQVIKRKYNITVWWVPKALEK